MFPVVQLAGRVLARRAAAAALLLLMVVGALTMWIAIPVAWLWLAGQLASSGTLIYLAALLGCPVTMLLWAIGLTRVHDAYLNVTHAGRAGPARSSWLKPMSGERGSRQPASVLDFIMAGSAAIAVVLLVLWYFLLAESFNPTYAPTP